MVAPEHCVECPVKHECLWAALSWADWYRTDSYLACLVWGGFYGATRNKAMHAADFRIKVAYKALLEKERENNGAPDQLRQRHSLSQDPSI